MKSTNQRIDQPIASFLIPVYNGEAYLAEALQSALAQTETNIEVVVVDDGSTDSSREILRRFTQQDARVRVFEEEHKGLVPTLNRGLEVARGKYICRLDADDIAMPDRVEKQVAFLEANPDHVLVGGQVLLIDGKGRVTGERRQPLSHADLEAEMKRHNCISHSSVMFRRAEVLGAGGYHPLFIYAEDYDLWVRLLAKYRMANLPDFVCKYREDGNQLSSSMSRLNIGFMMMCIRASFRGASHALICASVQAERKDYYRVMRGLGFENEEIAEGVFGGYLHWVGQFRQLGRREDSLKLLAEAIQLLKEWKCSDLWLARFYSLQVLLALDTRDYFRAAEYISRGIALSPTETIERMRNKFLRTVFGRANSPHAGQA